MKWDQVGQVGHGISIALNIRIYFTEIEVSSSEKDIEVDKATGSCPTEGAMCLFSITSQDALDPLTFPTGEDMEWQIGEGDNNISEKIDETLYDMRTEERKEIHMFVDDIPAPEQSDIAHSALPHPMSEYKVTVHLKHFNNQPPAYLLPMREKFRIASDHKEKGVELFRTGNIEFAFKRFSKALKYLILMMPERDIPVDLKLAHRQLRCQCYSNMAACQLKFHSYKYVIENCTKALAIDPNNVKCLYRRAEARKGTMDLVGAKEDVSRALKESPNSTSFHILKQKLMENEQK